MKHRRLIPLALLALSLPLMAAQGRVFHDTTGSISVYGLQPGERIKVGIDSAPDRDITSNRCGLLVIAPSERFPLATVQVEGEVINPSGLSTAIRPNCRQKSDGSYALDEARTSHFLSSSGDMVIVGKLPNTRYSVTYPGQLKLLTRQVNACGFLRVQESSSINFNQSILLPSTNDSIYAEFQINSLPEARPLLCYHDQLYLPQPWTDIFAEAIPNSEVPKAIAEGATILPSRLAAAGGTTGSGSSGSTGGTTGSTGTGSSGGSTGSGTTGGSTSGSTGGTSGSTNGGSTGNGSTNSGTTGGGTTGGSTGNTANLHNFTAASYDPKLHDYNNDGLIDDVNGDGVPDDRDGDGFPDGPWSPTDLPNSAGPGFTIPDNASVCIGFNGNLVAASYGFTRGQTYYLSADHGMPAGLRDPLGAAASYGSAAGAPVARFNGDYRNSATFRHSVEESDRNGYIARDDYMESIIDQFRFPQVPSCLVPSWLINPPSWLSQNNESLRFGLIALENWKQIGR